jgi:hypothetical protein
MFTESEKHQIIYAKNLLRSHLAKFVSIASAWAKYISLHDSAVLENFYVAGGAIPSLLQGEEVKDIDIYCRDSATSKHFLTWIEQHHSYLIDTVDEKYREVMGKDGLMITENAMTLKLGSKVQLITIHYGKPEDVTATFDFEHCTTTYDILTDKLMMSRLQFDCIIKKHLIVRNTNAFTIGRFKKFLSRNYTYDKTEIVI